MDPCFIIGIKSFRKFDNLPSPRILLLKIRLKRRNSRFFTKVAYENQKIGNGNPTRILKFSVNIDSRDVVVSIFTIKNGEDEGKFEVKPENPLN